MHIQLRPFAWAEYAAALLEKPEPGLVLIAFDVISYTAINQMLTRLSLPVRVTYEYKQTSPCNRCCSVPPATFCTSPGCIFYCHHALCIKQQIVSGWRNQKNRCTCGFKDYCKNVKKFTKIEYVPAGKLG